MNKIGRKFDLRYDTACANNRFDGILKNKIEIFVVAKHAHIDQQTDLRDKPSSSFWRL